MRSFPFEPAESGSHPFERFSSVWTSGGLRSEIRLLRRRSERRRSEAQRNGAGASGAGANAESRGASPECSSNGWEPSSNGWEPDGVQFKRKRSFGSLTIWTSSHPFERSFSSVWTESYPCLFPGSPHHSGMKGYNFDPPQAHVGRAYSGVFILINTLEIKIPDCVFTRFRFDLIWAKTWPSIDTLGES